MSLYILYPPACFAVMVRQPNTGRELLTEGRLLCGRTGRVGVEAFFVEEEDAGAEGEEHDSEAGGDAETGDDGRGTIVAAANDDVAGDGN